MVEKKLITLSANLYKGQQKKFFLHQVCPVKVWCLFFILNKKLINIEKHPTLEVKE
jgi:hypothetical protein